MASRRDEDGDGSVIETYYRFNPNVAFFLPVVETRYKPDENGNAVDQEYYIFAVEGNWGMFEEEYAEFDMYPTWAGEWGDMITADEYEAKISKGSVFEPPMKASVLDFEGF